MVPSEPSHPVPPRLDREEPELADEADIPQDDQGADAPPARGEPAERTPGTQ